MLKRTEFSAFSKCLPNSPVLKTTLLPFQLTTPAAPCTFRKRSYGRSRFTPDSAGGTGPGHGLRRRPQGGRRLGGTCRRTSAQRSSNSKSSGAAAVPPPPPHQPNGAAATRQTPAAATPPPGRRTRWTSTSRTPRYRRFCDPSSQEEQPQEAGQYLGGSDVPRRRPTQLLAEATRRAKTKEALAKATTALDPGTAGRSPAQEPARKGPPVRAPQSGELSSSSWTP